MVDATTKPVKIRPRDKEHYVKNADFYAAYLEWYKDILKAKDAGKEEPQMPRYIAECILKICTRLAYRPNFLNYSYREEMIGDAIENCIKVAKNFNPLKSENPFSWITTIAYNAFLRRIEAEKKQSIVKAHLIRDLPIEDLLDHQDHDDDTSIYHNQFIEFLRDNNYLQIPEDKKRAKVPSIVEEESYLEMFMIPQVPGAPT